MESATIIAILFMYDVASAAYEVDTDKEFNHPCCIVGGLSRSKSVKIALYFLDFYILP